MGVFKWNSQKRSRPMGDGKNRSRAQYSESKGNGVHYTLYASRDRKKLRKMKKEEKKRRKRNHQSLATKAHTESLANGGVMKNCSRTVLLEKKAFKLVDKNGKGKDGALQGSFDDKNEGNVKSDKSGGFEEDEEIIRRLGKKVGNKRWNDGLDDLLKGICEDLDDGYKNEGACFHDESSSVSSQVEDWRDENMNGESEDENEGSEGTSDKIEEANEEVNVELSDEGDLDECQQNVKGRMSIGDDKVDEMDYVALEFRVPVSNADCKLIRGLVNRLTEGNLTKIFEDIEGIFSKNPRHDVYNWFCDCILDDCTYFRGGASTFLYAPTYAALVVMVHLVIGMDFGGFVIGKVARYLEHCLDDRKMAIARNLLLLFVSFFNYDLIHCSLFYDLVKLLVNGMNEDSVDLLILVIQRCGSKLRSNDPNSLKDILTLINEVVGKWRESPNDGPRGAYNKRVQLMLEMLNNLKNNKISHDYGLTEGRLNNTIKAYLKCRFKKNPPQLIPLNISWIDLTSRRSGRWWLLGSSFQIPSDQVESAKAIDSHGISVCLNDGLDPEILALSKTQKMNTNLRKAIFGVLVTSENYLEAFERLMGLKIPKNQLKEIANVILHCSEQESLFNPYYLFLVQKFCVFENRYKVLFKMALWNRLDGIEFLTVRQISHNAELFGYLIGSKIFSFSIFKNVENFCENSYSILFFKMLLITIFINFEESQVEATFDDIKSLTNSMKFVTMLNIFFEMHMKKIKPEIAHQLLVKTDPKKTNDQQELILKIQKMMRLTLDVLSSFKDKKNLL